jgi:hypothetical protein
VVFYLWFFFVLFGKCLGEPHSPLFLWQQGKGGEGGQRRKHKIHEIPFAGDREDFPPQVLHIFLLVYTPVPRHTKSVAAAPFMEAAFRGVFFVYRGRGNNKKRI